jgi:hypothetical protein
MQYAWVVMTTGDLLPKRRGESDCDCGEAGDCQRMEYAEGVLAMQRQRRQIHEYKRKDIDGSDHTVGMGTFGQHHDGGTRA